MDNSDRDTRLATQYTLGLRLFQQGVYDRAIECWEGAVFFDPKNFRVLTYMGLAHTHLGQIREGIRCYERALEVEPKYAKTWNLLGNAYRQTGEIFRALEAYRKAIEYRPRDLKMVYNLAITLFDCLDYEEAIPHFECLLVGEGENPEILLYLFNSHYRLERFEEANRFLDRYLAIAPDDREKDRFRTARRMLSRFQEEEAVTRAPSASLSDSELPSTPETRSVRDD